MGFTPCNGAQSRQFPEHFRKLLHTPESKLQRYIRHAVFTVQEHAFTSLKTKRHEVLLGAYPNISFKELPQIYAVSLSSERAAVDAANKAGVPIFFQYGYHPDLLPKSAGFMQIDLKGFARPLGEWMAENIPSGKIAIIEGTLGRGDAEAYTEGFLEGLAKNPNLQVVAKVSAEWNRQKAYEAAMNIITAHPDIVGMFVQNEDMAVGVVNALERLGKLEQVKIVS